MATLKTIRKNHLQRHLRYERQVVRALHSYFKNVAKTIDFSLLRQETYDSFIQNHVTNNFDIYDIYKRIYVGIGLRHGAIVGKQLNLDAKNFVLGKFDEQFIADVSQYLTQFGSRRIILVERTFHDYINNLLTKQLEDGKPFDEAVKELTQKINRSDFYEWQAKRIARTETTAAMNYASLKAGESTLFQIEKRWISIVDSRTRDGNVEDGGFNHLEADNLTVMDYEAFNVSDELLQYPGDPTASAGNVINCRCGVSLRPKRDENGNLMFKTDVVNKPIGLTADVIAPGTEPDEIEDDTFNDMASFESSIKDQYFESAGAYTKDGKLLFSKDGQKSSVTMNTEEILMLAKNKGAVFTHNHPRSSSFSLADINFLVSNECSEMRAVTRDGIVYRMKYNTTYKDLPFKYRMDWQAILKKDYDKSFKKAKKVVDKWFENQPSQTDKIARQANINLSLYTWRNFTETASYKDLKLEYIIDLMK